MAVPVSCELSIWYVYFVAGWSPVNLTVQMWLEQYQDA